MFGSVYFFHFFLLCLCVCVCICFSLSLSARVCMCLIIALLSCLRALPQRTARRACSADPRPLQHFCGSAHFAADLALWGSKGVCTNVQLLKSVAGTSGELRSFEADTPAKYEHALTGAVIMETSNLAVSGRKFRATYGNFNKALRSCPAFSAVWMSFMVLHSALHRIPAKACMLLLVLHIPQNVAHNVCRTLIGTPEDLWSCNILDPGTLLETHAGSPDPSVRIMSATSAYKKLREAGLNEQAYRGQTTPMCKIRNHMQMQIHRERERRGTRQRERGK